MSEHEWEVAYASVEGISHRKSGAPNQDAVAVRSSDSLGIFACVVCDGAGTAPKAEQGSRFFADYVANQLLVLAKEIEGGELDPKLVNERLLHALMNARAQINSTGFRMSDFHTTLNAVVVTRRIFISIRVGDGLTLTSQAKETSAEPPTVNFLHGWDADKGQRGEFANETYFITQPDWQRRLLVRTSDPSEFDLILLTTDGAADVAMDRKRPDPKFLNPLVGRVISLPTPAARNESLSNAFGAAETNRLTDDDKTAVLLFRRSLLKYRGRHVSPELPEPRTAATGSSALTNTADEIDAEENHESQLLLKAVKSKRDFVGNPAFAALLFVAGIGAGTGLPALWTMTAGDEGARPSNKSVAAKAAAPAKPQAPVKPLTWIVTVPPLAAGDKDVKLNVLINRAVDVQVRGNGVHDQSSNETAQVLGCLRATETTECSIRLDSTAQSPENPGPYELSLESPLGTLLLAGSIFRQKPKVAPQPPSPANKKREPPKPNDERKHS